MTTFEVRRILFVCVFYLIFRYCVWCAVLFGFSWNFTAIISYRATSNKTLTLYFELINIIYERIPIPNGSHHFSCAIIDRVTQREIRFRMKIPYMSIEYQKQHISCISSTNPIASCIMYIVCTLWWPSWPLLDGLNSWRIGNRKFDLHNSQPIFAFYQKSIFQQHLYTCHSNFNSNSNWFVCLFCIMHNSKVFVK